MDIISLIARLEGDPQTQVIVQALQPFLPVLAREGQSFYDEVLSYIVEGKWDTVDALAWEKMTDQEREFLSNQVLDEARAAVDSAYEREANVKSAVIKVILALLTALAG
jgi:leucyl-tRNA synthetase